MLNELAIGVTKHVNVAGNCAGVQRIYKPPELCVNNVNCVRWQIVVGLWQAIGMNGTNNRPYVAMIAMLKCRLLEKRKSGKNGCQQGMELGCSKKENIFRFL